MESTVGGNLLPQTEFDLPLNLATSAAATAVGDYPINGDTYQIAAKAATNLNTQPQGKKPKGASGGVGGDGAVSSSSRGGNTSGQTGTQKPKRVRTGCLTCRERHLKCDETLPRCQNCQKSDRLCKRGVRLNFIDTHVAAPPYAAPYTHNWQVSFKDDSRDIASEYQGGFERYPRIDNEQPAPRKQLPSNSYGFPDIMGAPALSHQNLPNAPPLLSSYPEPPHPEMAEAIIQHTSQAHHHNSAFPGHSLPQSSFNSPNSELIHQGNVRSHLDTPEEVLLMQVFIEEVGLWMDSMDSMKHFSNILPFHALQEPMLLNAFLACGARHLFLVNPSFGEEKALYYYKASTGDLLTCLQNPNRDTVLCATTAVILNVYEIMCERAMQRMNHIAGARALIKECRWDAKTGGVGGACFWLNVGMELLSCLHFNWTMAWDPDTWDIDMSMTPSPNPTGDEELWTHRMVYICAKIANFRSTIPQFQDPDRTAHDMRLSSRIQEWNTYKGWCDEWARCVPRSMLPLGYLHTWQTTSKSSFPEVWLIKRTAVVARLFYHTSCCLLAQIHPTESEFSQSMMEMQQSHANDICGIVAHVKDSRGVGSVSLRCLAIAAECLTNRQAQEEVLQIIDKIMKETGWQVAFLRGELMERWGWNTNSSSSPSQQQQQQQQTSASTTSSASAPTLLSSSSLLNSSLPNPNVSTPSRPRMPQGIVNPLMATADFSYENHPYQSHYVAPHSQSHLGSYQQYESY
ncbi:hypothetical protein AJ79_07651 [Helicocarpus griseus UAMH5409]|uniref:Zn(2)-C6 fungal-type domain-containing protein n=1 Tax=Helicocarpus griseus UAMH5409 TaxID=1447875 RepID=A0A2B7X0K7_9EURO|nr:hypothetical protein AJ79_07651 [Helicocarpus griseus UAMH5409]